MGEVHVQFESLLAGQEGIGRTFQSLTGTLDQLESDLGPMISSWSGSAQESYLQCKQQWDTAAQELALVLSNIGRSVGQAHENYQGAESVARSNWA